MPITHSFDPATTTLRVKLEGTLELDELRAHFDTLLADDRIPARTRVLIDASAQLGVASTALLQFVSQGVGRLARRFRFTACAFVAANASQYGMFRMAQVFLEAYFGQTNVFMDVAEAERWLRERAPDPS